MPIPLAGFDDDNPALEEPASDQLGLHSPLRRDLEPDAKRRRLLAPQRDKSPTSTSRTTAASDVDRKPASEASHEHDAATNPVSRRITPAKRISGFFLRARRLTPSWFSTVMGTGICNTLLFQLPWTSTHPAFRAIGVAFLLLAMILFAIFGVLSVYRYLKWPEIARVLIRHETHSLFLGTIPMAFVTIVSGIAFVGLDYGIDVIHATTALWWIALVMSWLTACGVPCAMFQLHTHEASGITALFLLPIVAPITVAASGSVMAAGLIVKSPDYALIVLAASYVCNGVGLLVALMVLVMYLQRLATFHWPPREIIISSFLPLGPCGQGGYALIRLGFVARQLFPIIAARSPGNADLQLLGELGNAMYATGLVAGLLLWGLGFFFAVLACFAVGSGFAAGRIKFNLGFWSATFPIGSWCLLTNALAIALDSLGLRVIGAAQTLCVIVIWLLVSVPTAIGFWRGSLLQAPCLDRLPPELRAVDLEKAANTPA